MLQSLSATNQFSSELNDSINA